MKNDTDEDVLERYQTASACRSGVPPPQNRLRWTLPGRSDTLSGKGAINVRFLDFADKALPGFLANHRIVLT